MESSVYCKSTYIWNKVGLRGVCIPMETTAHINGIAVGVSPHDVHHAFLRVAELLLFQNKSTHEDATRLFTHCFLAQSAAETVM